MRGCRITLVTSILVACGSKSPPPATPTPPTPPAPSAPAPAPDAPPKASEPTSPPVDHSVGELPLQGDRPAAVRVTHPSNVAGSVTFVWPDDGRVTVQKIDEKRRNLWKSKADALALAKRQKYQGVSAEDLADGVLLQHDGHTETKTVFEVDAYLTIGDAFYACGGGGTTSQDERAEMAAFCKSLRASTP